MLDILFKHHLIPDNIRYSNRNLPSIRLKQSFNSGGHRRICCSNIHFNLVLISLSPSSIFCCSHLYSFFSFTLKLFIYWVRLFDPDEFSRILSILLTLRPSHPFFCHNCAANLVHESKWNKNKLIQIDYPYLNQSSLIAPFAYLCLHLHTYTCP